MSDLIPWEYAGIEFKVSNALTPDQRDGVCSVLLSEYDHRRGNVSEYSQTVSKPSNKSGGVIPHLTAKDALEDDWGTSTAVVGDWNDLPGRRAAIALGIIPAVATQNNCRVCGNVIKPTGRRGRPRKIHEECAK